MKHFQYIIIAFVCAVFASCMGNDFDEPALTESPWGNNAIEETNVMTIADLKMRYANTIGGNMMEEVKDDIKIKGIVTGNDIQGNIYNEIAIQDETGGILVCIAQGGLFGYLPVGQEVLIDLKGLMIGGYGQQAEIGGVYTNSSTGAQSIGRMSRYLWASHYKLLGTPDASRVKPEVFDQSRIDDAQYLADNAGKLMTLKGVVLKDADGQNAFAPDDGSVALVANCANRQFTGIDASKMVLRTSSYADFANVPMPQGEVDVTGIFTRYRDTWQILLRTEDDITEHSEEDNAIFSETFLDTDRKQGDFIIYDVVRGDGIDYVWGFDSRYGMKATSFVGNAHDAESWLISPSIDLSNVRSAKLSFSHAANYFANDIREECYVMVSTDFTGIPDNIEPIPGNVGYMVVSPMQFSTWEDLDPYRDAASGSVTNPAFKWPENGWKFVTAEIDLTPYCGMSNVRIAFVYTSSAQAAGTWEINTFRVE